MGHLKALISPKITYYNMKTKPTLFKFILTTFISSFLFQLASSQGTSDAVYEAPSSNTTKFYKEMAGTSPTNTFVLGEPVYAQFLFTEKPAEQIPSDEHVRATVMCNGIVLAYQDFKQNDEVLAVYLAETYSLDINVIATSASFKEIKGLTEASLTDRKLSIMTYFIEGLYRDMFVALSGKLFEGSYTMKVSLDCGKEEWDNEQQQQIFKISKTFSSGEFTMKVTRDQIDKYRKDMLTNFGEVINANFARIKDEGVKGGGQNLNKVMFANSAITESSSSFKSSFGGLSEGIYSRVYLPQSVYNMSADLGVGGKIRSYDIVYYMDGKYITSLTKDMSDADLKSKTSWELSVAPAEVNDDNQAVVYNFAKALVKASVGKHRFKVVLRVNYLNTWNAGMNESADIATGEFDLNVTESDKTALLKKLCPQFSWINNHTQLVPNSFSMVDQTKRPDEKVIKVVVLDNDWTYQRNFWGVILSRTIRGKGIIQNTRTGLCFEIDILFSQQNISSGGSEYATTQFVRTGEYDNSVWFAEDCIKR